MCRISNLDPPVLERTYQDMAAMPIPHNPNEQKHADWTSVGSDATAKKTHASLQTALDGLARQRDVEIFLQGSYANHTNIRADSDVDVVVMTRQTYRGNANSASMAPELRAAWSNAPTATYLTTDLRRDVLAALRSYYGAEFVEEKNKCIKIHKRDGYLDADVVPCIQYRHYSPQSRALRSGYKEGVAIHPVTGDVIVNFPKEHKKNGQNKNKDCSKRYKATVRQVKRLRNDAVRLGLLESGGAPGYLLECMVFNAPRRLFGPHDSDRLHSVVEWLTTANLAGFDSCDRINTLFGTDPGGFTIERGELIARSLNAAINA